MSVRKYFKIANTLFISTNYATINFASVNFVYIYKLIFVKKKSTNIWHKIYIVYVRIHLGILSDIAHIYVQSHIFSYIFFVLDTTFGRQKLPTR